MDVFALGSTSNHLKPLACLAKEKLLAYCRIGWHHGTIILSSWGQTRCRNHAQSINHTTSARIDLGNRDATDGEVVKNCFNKNLVNLAAAQAFKKLALCSCLYSQPTHPG